jgi:hypothetical protein
MNRLKRFLIEAEPSPKSPYLPAGIVVNSITLNQNAKIALLRDKIQYAVDFH